MTPSIFSKPLFSKNVSIKPTDDVVTARVPLNRKLWLSFKALTYLRGLTLNEELNKLIMQWIENCDSVKYKCCKCDALMDNQNILYTKTEGIIVTYYCSIDCIISDNNDKS